MQHVSSAREQGVEWKGGLLRESPGAVECLRGKW